MFVCFGFEDDSEERDIDVWDEAIRGPYPTLIQAMKGLEVLKADCGVDVDFAHCHQRVYLNGDGPHSAGRMRIEFRVPETGMMFRIVEVVPHG